jgi:hypothetical protein
MLRLASPNNEHLPAKFFQFQDVPLITLDVTGQLFLPESLVTCRSCGSMASLVFVPKTTMDENDLLVSGKDYIGLTRKFLIVKPKTVAHRVQNFSHDQLGLCVDPGDSRHYPAALLFGEDV